MSRNETDQTKIPDPEVARTAQPRQFTAKEKLCILEEADACTEPGEIGALVRREGIYSSYLSRWRLATGTLEQRSHFHTFARLLQRLAQMSQLEKGGVSH